MKQKTISNRWVLPTVITVAVLLIVTAAILLFSSGNDTVTGDAKFISISETSHE